ncbi:MAG: NAD(P)H-hydrate dehydratase [Clostridia bacterium]|nr:NAD(P)H-hydrate dehydratase [Clostridia bacterium]
MERKTINKNSLCVLTASKMREIDETTIESTGIPGIVLMENAAISVVDEIKKRFSVQDTSFAIFAGKGNNGGDGFAVARHLFQMGANVFVYLTQGSFFDGDALTNYRILRQMQVPMADLTGDEYLKNYIESADCVIDAIFGTGLAGNPRGVSGEVIRKINEYSKFTVSVDIPSGVDSDTGRVYSDAVKADLTVTFQAYKRGHLLYPGAELSGEVVVRDIGIPKYVTDLKGGKIFVPTLDDIYEALPKRQDNSNKADYGKLMIVGGSVGMAGAVSMATRASLKMGIGLVTAAVPQTINNIIQTKIDEAMTLPLPDKMGKVTSEMAEKIAERANRCDAVLIGPGLGRGEEVTGFVSVFLENLEVPVVIDADAIYAIKDNIQIFGGLKGEVIITPHSKELEYLTGTDVETIESNRLSVAIEFAKENNVTLILKGHHTIITAPDGFASVNITGNSGMAGAGSGDVLSGMVSALLAKGMDAYSAAVSAVYLHGMAGDKAKESYGKESMCAGDITDSIYKILPVEI